MRKLPSLNIIRAFEAAARHVSFTIGAQELQVVHGSISKQVPILERCLGIDLFARPKSQVVLTSLRNDFVSSLLPALVVDEFHGVRCLTGSTIQISTAHSLDPLIPAQAEIVIEGLVDLEWSRLEYYSEMM